MFNVKVGARQAFSNWQLRYGRIYGVYLFRKPVLIVTDLDALKQIFVKDFNHYTDRYFVGEGKLQHSLIQTTIFFAEGGVWKRLRKIMTPTFSTGKLRQLTHCMNRTAGNLARYLNTQAVLGASPEAKIVFGAYALDVIAGVSFGIDLDSLSDLNAPFIQHAKSLMTFDRVLQLKLSLAGIFPWLIPFLKMFKIGYFKYTDIKFFQENLKMWVSERVVSSENRPDFLQLLLEAEFEQAEGIKGESKLTMDEVAAQALFFLIAGYETTSTSLQFLFYELAKNEDIQERIVDEINSVIGKDKEPTYDNCQHLKYTEAAIEEILRMYPPVHILTRKTTKATVLNGIHVPADVGIFIPAYNVSRDPEFFHNPDTFNPERFMDEFRHNMNPVSFLPFGYGPRQCIGMRLAIMEIKIALVHVMRKLKALSATPEVLEIVDYHGTLAPEVPIKIMFQVRTP